MNKNAPEDPTPLDFLTYCEKYPQDYEQFKQTVMFKSLIQTLDDKIIQTMYILAHSSVKTDEDVGMFNHDQGLMKAAEEIKSILENPYVHIERKQLREEAAIREQEEEYFPADPDDRGNYLP